jgi:hypothetical protein
MPVTESRFFALRLPEQHYVTGFDLSATGFAGTPLLPELLGPGRSRGANVAEVNVQRSPRVNFR